MTSLAFVSSCISLLLCKTGHVLCLIQSLDKSWFFSFFVFTVFACVVRGTRLAPRLYFCVEGMACLQRPSALSVEFIQPHDLAKHLHSENEYVLLDCRPVLAYNSCHISGAVNVNFTGE